MGSAAVLYARASAWAVRVVLWVLLVALHAVALGAPNVGAGAV